MDFQRQMEAGYLQVRELNNMVSECRDMALHLGFILSWSISEQTATAYIKFGDGVIWKAKYTDKMPHLIVCRMYYGLHTELSRRVKENRESIIRMRQAEEARRREKEIMDMPTWQERRGR